MNAERRQHGSFEYHFEQSVAPHHLARFQRFCERLDQLVILQDGFISVDRQAMEQGPEACVFRTSLRFATIQQCMNWLDNPQRRRLLVQEEEEAGFRFQGKANWMGYGRWLSRRIKRRVPTWKVNLMVLLTLYPSAMLLAPVLRGLLPGASAATLMLVSNTLCIAATSWVLVPGVSRAYRRWLEGDTPPIQAWISLLSLAGLLTLLWWGFSSVPITGGR